MANRRPQEPMPAPDVALTEAVRQIVRNVRSGWPDADPVDAVTFALETVGRGDLDPEDPFYLAYLVMFGSTPGVVLGFAQRQKWAEDKERASRFKNGDDVQVMTTGARGTVVGNPMPSPFGWVVTIKYTPEWEGLSVTRGADYKVAELMHYTP